MSANACAIVGVGQTHHKSRRLDVSFGGLVRIAEAATEIRDRGRQRTLAHSTSGPCLQQNLVCVLEGGSK